MTTPHRPKRRFVYFGALLFATVLLFAAAGGVSIWMPYHREQVAVAEIVRVGGTVVTRPGGPDWLRKLVGDEYMGIFDRVTAVKLTGTQIDDSCLQLLAELPHIVTLELGNTAITSDGLVQVAGLTHLSSLTLTNTGVSDAGLQHIAGLSNLELLWLDRTQVTDAGLKHLVGLKKLEWLFFSRTYVTEAAADRLSASLPGCRVLFDE